MDTVKNILTFAAFILMMMGCNAIASKAEAFEVQQVQGHCVGITKCVVQTRAGKVAFTLSEGNKAKLSPALYNTATEEFSINGRCTEWGTCDFIAPQLGFLPFQVEVGDLPRFSPRRIMMGAKEG